MVTPNIDEAGGGNKRESKNPRKLRSDPSILQGAKPIATRQGSTCRYFRINLGRKSLSLSMHSKRSYLKKGIDT
jgi:hypothetical protein